MPDVESRTSQDFKYVATVGKSYGIFHRQRVKSPTKIEGNIGQHVGPGIAKKLKMRVKIMGLELNLHTLTSLSHDAVEVRPNGYIELFFFELWLLLLTTRAGPSSNQRVRGSTLFCVYS